MPALTPVSKKKMRLLSRQSWNPLALIATARTLIRRPGLLVPHVAVRNVDELNYDALRAAGVASIIFDKDNTLTAPYVDTAHVDVSDAITRAKDAFGADNCVVLSNSAGSGDDAPEYNAAKACEAALGLRVARHPDAQKPQCLEGVVDSLGKDAGAVAVVGDRLATDVLAANQCGALSVHTRPLDTKGDNPAALVSRFLENRILLPLLRRLGAAPPTHPAVADLAHTQPGTALPPPAR